VLFLISSVSRPKFLQPPQYCSYTAPPNQPRKRPQQQQKYLVTMSFSAQFPHPGSHNMMQPPYLVQPGSHPTSYDSIFTANGSPQPIETFRLDIPTPQRSENDSVDPQTIISDTISLLYIPTFQVLRALALSDRSMTIWSTDQSIRSVRTSAPTRRTSVPPVPEKSRTFSSLAPRPRRVLIKCAAH
jgi:hypothetical protein